MAPGNQVQTRRAARAGGIEELAISGLCRAISAIRYCFVWRRDFSEAIAAQRRGVQLLYGGCRVPTGVSRSLANEPGERVSASRGNSSEADAESVLFAEA